MTKLFIVVVLHRKSFHHNYLKKEGRRRQFDKEFFLDYLYNPQDFFHHRRGKDTE